MQEIAKALIQERELQQREWESQVVAMERERSQHIVDEGLLQGYIGILIGEMRGQGMSIPSTPFIPGWDTRIKRHAIEYGALHQGRLHFRLQDGSQVPQLGESTILLFQLLVMVSMMAGPRALLMILSEMMILLRFQPPLLYLYDDVAPAWACIFLCTLSDIAPWQARYVCNILPKSGPSLYLDISSLWVTRCMY